MSSSKKSFLIQYFVCPIGILIAIGVWYFMFTNRGTETLDVPAQHLYYIRMFTQLHSLGTILGAFTFFRNKHNFMVATVNLSCLYIAIDYFLHINMPDQSNLINNLYILLILYIWKFFIIIKSPDKEGNNE